MNQNGHKLERKGEACIQHLLHGRFVFGHSYQWRYFWLDPLRSTRGVGMQAAEELLFSFY